MKTKPTKGMKVRLNDHGIAQIGGLQSWAQVEAARCMTIVQVDHASLTHPEQTFGIEVDQPEIGRFMLDHTYVEPL